MSNLKSVRINVTQGDVEAGLPNNAAYCPVARAVNRKLKEGYRSKISHSCGIYQNGVCEEVFDLPKKAYDWWNAFDAGEDVCSFTFTLKLPEEYLKGDKTS